MRWRRPKTHERRIADHMLLLIQCDGWTQKYMRSDDGKRCLLGALIDAQRDVGYKGNSGAHVIEAFHRRMDTGMTRWNDTPGRTEREVVRLIKKVRRAL